MLLKKVFVCFLFVLFIFGAAYSMEYDKQYAKTYGTGNIIAADTLPLRDKFILSQVDYRDGVSYIKGGEGAALCFRAFLKDGKDYNYFMKIFKKGYAADKIVEGSERIVVTFWASHSFRGDKQMETWPTKLSDGEHLSSSGQIGHIDFDISEVMDYKDTGASWDNIKENFDGAIENWLVNAKPGYKLYLSLGISLVVNTDWDPYAQKWNTMYCPSAPLAAGTIEIK